MSSDKPLPLDREGIRDLILSQMRIQNAAGFDSPEGERLGLQMAQNIQDRIDLMSEEDQRTFETLYVKESQSLVNDLQAPARPIEEQEKARAPAKVTMAILITFVAVMFLILIYQS